MSYFQDQSKNYLRALKDQLQPQNFNNKNTKIEETENASQQQQYKYAQYKLDKPKNPIVMKSIYTQNSSLFLRMQPSEEDEQYYGQFYKNHGEGQEDIHQFIQNSKTLKEKIYEKLQKNKKKPKGTKLKITQTTFRPSQAPKSHFKENVIAMTNITNITNRKSFQPTSKGQMNKVIKTQRLKTQRKKTEAQNLEIGSKWDPFKQNELRLSQLSFHQRQKKTLQNKKDQSERIGTELKKKQLEGCTFKPKLTKYKPKRL